MRAIGKGTAKLPGRGQDDDKMISGGEKLQTSEILFKVQHVEECQFQIVAASQNVAIGLKGEPVPPSTAKGAAVTMNSQRFIRFAV